MSLLHAPRSEWEPPAPSDDLLVQVDHSRRHYDQTDAEAVVRRLGRDFEIHLRYEPCPFRSGLFHIEFDTYIGDLEMRALQARVDGYGSMETARHILGKNTKLLYRRLNKLAWRVGAQSNHTLTSLAVYFGICPLSLMHERLVIEVQLGPRLMKQKYAAGARRSMIRNALARDRNADKA